MTTQKPDLCVGCHKRKVRYVAPKYWCTFCWADWWFDPYEGAGTILEKYWWLIINVTKDIVEDAVSSFKVRRDK